MKDSAPARETVASSAKALGQALFADKVRAVEIVPRGVMNHKFRVALEGGEYFILRLYPPLRERVVEYEPDLLRRCNSAGLPVPDVLVDSRVGPEVGWAYTVYRWLPGVPLDERLPALGTDALTVIAHELLGFLHRLARLPVVGHGDLVSATAARFTTRRDFFQTVISEAEPGVTGSNWEPGAFTRLTRWLNEAALAVPEGQPVLAWGDLSPENILLDPHDRIAGIIDFEGTMAGNFCLTLGYAYARLMDTRFFDALRRIWPGAGEPNIDRATEVYAVLRALRLARFANTPMPTGCARRPLGQVLPGFQHLLRKMSVDVQ